MSALRLLPRQAGTHTDAPAASAAAAAVTGICVGEGYEKLLWTATADGRIRSWRLTATTASTAATASSSTTAAAAGRDFVDAPSTPEARVRDAEAAAALALS